MGKKYELKLLILCDDIIGAKEQIKAALEKIPGVEAVSVPDVRWEQEAFGRGGNGGGLRPLGVSRK